MGDTTPRYGLLLPHFGEHASREALLGFARDAERYGFDSLFARDHIVFHPHPMEGRDRTMADTLVTLGLVAGVTTKLLLGTAALIPHRHPIHTAQALGSLEYVAGPGRVVLGFGLGTWDHEFEALGLGGIPRKELFEEQVAIMRLLWGGGEVSFEGKYYRFKDVDIHPLPSGGSIPIWYCGDTVASVRRAVKLCDGWLPGRIPLRTWDARVERMRRLCEEAGRSMPTLACIPVTSPARTREAALSKVNWQGMLKVARGKPDWAPPESGRWESPEDLEGALIAGPPEQIVEATRRHQEHGLSHIVYDLRFRFSEWEECLEILGEEVLPELRRGDSA